MNASNNKGGLNGLTEHERAVVIKQVDYFIELLSERYEITPMEVVEAVKWAKRQQGLGSKAGFAAAVAIIGTAVTAMAYVLWRGIIHTFEGMFK